MSGGDDELEDDELDPWSRHGPDAARLHVVAASFQELIVFGWNAAARLKRKDRLQDLVNLHREALMCGVNDEDVRRALAIVQDMAEAAGGADKLAPRRRGRPRKPVKPKPAKQEGKVDRQILADARRISLELELKAREVNRERLYRSARKAAIDSAEDQGHLKVAGDPSTNRKRIDRLRKRDVEQLKRQLTDALLGVSAPQNGTQNSEKSADFPVSKCPPKPPET
jgi:hypothetical protein